MFQTFNPKVNGAFQPQMWQFSHKLFFKWSVQMIFPHKTHISSELTHYSHGHPVILYSFCNLVVHWSAHIAIYTQISLFTPASISFANSLGFILFLFHLPSAFFPVTNLSVKCVVREDPVCVGRDESASAGEC